MTSGLPASAPLVPRRIAVFLYGYDAPGSGTQSRTLTLARAFAARGHAVDAVVVRAGDALRAEISAPIGLSELHAWTTRLPALSASWRAMLYGSVPALARYVRRQRPDVLLSSATHIHLAALWAWRLAGARGRLVLRESNHPNGAQQRFAYRFYRWADAVIAVSDGVARHVIAAARLPSSHVNTVYNPLELEAIRVQARAPVPHPWLEPGRPPVLLAVGRLTPQKDFRMLLRAFARLRALRPARLIVLGDGSPSRLSRLAGRLGISDDLAFCGYVPNPFAYMARAAVFVLTSAWEGLPGALIEALACGCPVVSTDCPSGPAEILEGGAYGPLVPVGDDAALAAAIASVLATTPDRARLRKRAAAFSVDAATQGYLRVLLPVANP